jgi:arylsulfatase A-like enzyme
MREERLQRAIEIGLVPQGTRLAPVPYDHRRWEDLSDTDKAYWARAMQVSAGMMDAADTEFGRLLDYLEAKGQLGNTVIIVASDNGPEYNTVGKTSTGVMLWIERAWMFVEGWNLDFDNLGQPGSLCGTGPGWATVSAAPLQLFKFNATEGGLRVPMLVSGPGIKQQGFTDSRAQVADIAPTILEVAGVPFAPGEFHGRSLMPILRGSARQVYTDTDTLAFETSGASALFRGNWKITKTLAPYGDDAWHLYDISVDPGETNDVSADHPELFEEMKREFAAYAERVGVYEMPPGTSARAQLTINGMKKIAWNYWHLILGFFAAIGLGIYGLVRGVLYLVRRRRASPA